MKLPLDTQLNHLNSEKKSSQTWHICVLSAWRIPLETVSKLMLGDSSLEGIRMKSMLARTRPKSQLEFWLVIIQKLLDMLPFRPELSLSNRLRSQAPFVPERNSSLNLEATLKCGTQRLANLQLNSIVLRNSTSWRRKSKLSLDALLRRNSSSFSASKIEVASLEWPETASPMPKHSNKPMSVCAWELVVTLPKTTLILLFWITISTPFTDLSNGAEPSTTTAGNSCNSRLLLMLSFASLQFWEAQPSVTLHWMSYKCSGQTWSWIFLEPLHSELSHIAKTNAAQESAEKDRSWFQNSGDLSFYIQPIRFLWWWFSCMPAPQCSWREASTSSWNQHFLLSARSSTPSASTPSFWWPSSIRSTAELSKDRSSTYSRHSLTMASSGSSSLENSRSNASFFGSGQTQKETD